MYYFTSDTHFGCNNLVKNTRKEFSSIEEHDKTLLLNINRTVTKHDTLVVLGDFCQSKPELYRKQIRSTNNVWFILGNHDHESKIRDCFGKRVWHHKIIRAKGGLIFCCHYPMAFWDKSHYGAYHAYGHLHYNAEREAMMNAGLPFRRSMDVGVDAARALLGEYRPFSEEEFFGFLGGATGHDIIKREERWDQKDYD